MEKFVKNLLEFLTPFSWHRLLAALALLGSVAVALYLTGCHVQRTVTSFATVKVDRLDTIRYDSYIHKDSRNYYHPQKLY